MSLGRDVDRVGAVSRIRSSGDPAGRPRGSAAKREQTKITALITDKGGKTKIVVSLDAFASSAAAVSFCKPVTDQNFPESHTDVANKWISLFARSSPTNPVAAQMVFQEPDNLLSSSRIQPDSTSSSKARLHATSNSPSGR